MLTCGADGKAARPSLHPTPHARTTPPTFLHAYQHPLIKDRNTREWHVDLASRGDRCKEGVQMAFLALLARPHNHSSLFSQGVGEVYAFPYFPTSLLGNTYAV